MSEATHTIRKRDNFGTEILSRIVIYKKKHSDIVDLSIFPHLRAGSSRSHLGYPCVKVLIIQHQFRVQIVAIY